MTETNEGGAFTNFGRVFLLMIFIVRSKRRSKMPVYEYECQKCGEKFSVTLRIKEHDEKKVKCPKCASSDVKQLIEPFHAVTAKKS